MDLTLFKFSEQGMYIDKSYEDWLKMFNPTYKRQAYSENAIKLIKKHESFYAFPVPIKNDNCVVGYKHITGRLHFRKQMDKELAEEFLKNDLDKLETKINQLELELTQNQFDAIISYVFDLGIHSFIKSVGYQNIIKGDMKQAAKDLFCLPERGCNGKSESYWKRRKDEMELFTNKKNV